MVVNAVQNFLPSLKSGLAPNSESLHRIEQWQHFVVRDDEPNLSKFDSNSNTAKNLRLLLGEDMEEVACVQRTGENREGGSREVSQPFQREPPLWLSSASRPLVRPLLPAGSPVRLAVTSGALQDQACPSLQIEPFSGSFENL